MSNQHEANLIIMLNWRNSSHKQGILKFLFGSAMGILKLSWAMDHTETPMKVMTLLHIHILHPVFRGFNKSIMDSTMLNLQDSTSQSWTLDSKLLTLSLILD